MVAELRSYKDATVQKRSVRIAVSCMIMLIVAFVCQPTLGQYIYYANYPAQCEMGALFYDTTAIFVHMPAYADIIGAHFRLDVDMFGPEDVDCLMLTPRVFIVEGDIFQGMTLSWTPLELNHYRLLKIYVVNNPPLQDPEQPGFCVREAILYRAGGDSLFLDDCWTGLGHVDCWDANLGFSHPDTADVFIGTQSIVEVRSWVSALGIIGTNFEISDTEDWVQDWHPKGVFWYECMVCPWEETIIQILVEVPQSIPYYTFSELTIRPTYHVFQPDSTSFTLRAVPPIAIEGTTWGQIKTLYRR